MRALLDVNALVALLDRDHVDHRHAREWISTEIRLGWASCAVTQNGFIRVLSQSRYPSPVSPMVAVELLRRATATEYHEFWPASASFLDGGRTLFRWSANGCGEMEWQIGRGSRPRSGSQKVHAALGVCCPFAVSF